VTGVRPDPIIASNQAQIITVLGGNFTADTRVTFRYLAPGAETPLVFASVPLRSFDSGSLSVFFIIGSAEGAWSLEATNANGTTGESIFPVISSNRGVEGTQPQNDTAQPETQLQTEGQPVGTKLPAATELANWQRMMRQTPKPAKGCFEASYPETEWREAQCTTAPDIPLLPAGRNGSGAETVGNGTDYAALVTGAITSATGEFDSVSGVDTETDSKQGANAFTLQLNTNNFKSAVCKDASTPANCQAWEQFVFSNGPNGGSAYIQYWLLGYGSSCPAPAVTAATCNGKVLTTGWCWYAPNNCVINGAKASSVPTQEIAALSSLELNGAAGAGSTDDSVTMHVGTKMYSAAGDNHFSDLGSLWTSAEFNIFGYGDSSAAQFNLGSTTVATVAVRTEVNDGALAPPQCAPTGYTGETNNLTLVGTPATESSVDLPSIVFTESNGSNPTAKSCTPEPEHAQTTTTVKSSLNPSTSGQSVTFTATVSGGNSPTGTVGFNSNGNSISGCSAVPLSSGAAQCTTSALPVGTDAIVATYSGDANNTLSTSSPLTQTVNAPPKITPAVAVALSSTSITTAQPLTVTVTVSPTSGNPTPTGTVTLTSPGFTTQTGTLNSSGIATIPILAGALPVGTDTLTANYSGDTKYNISSGTKQVTVTVAAKPPTASTGAATAITSSSATLNGTVNPNGADTHAWFLWGTSSTLSGASQTSSQDLGSGTSQVAFTANLTGLSAGTKYYFQVVAQNSGSTTKGAINSFTTTTVPPTASTGSASAITTSSATLAGTVNPNGIDTHFYFLYGTSSTLSGANQTASYDLGSGTTASAVSVNLAGLNASTTYYYQMVAQNSAGTVKGGINSFVTLAKLPTATTGSATSVTSTSATLNGTVNPNGADTHVWFLWGTSSTLSGANQTSSYDLGSGTSASAITASPTGLTPNTTYYFQMVAQNSAGTAKGAINSFITPAKPPTATTGSATSVTSTSATLNGTVNPNGADTHVWFLWGTSSTLSGANQTASYDLGSGTSASAITASPTGLTPNTTYYFQMVAQNSAGTVKGTINSFLTLAKLPTATTGSATSVTSTSATLNGTVNPNGADTHVWFLWGTGSTLSGANQTSSYDLGSGTSASAITASPTGLTPNTTYYFQMVAQNSAGTAKGTINSFITLAKLPTATTGSATSVTSSSAALNGTVNPNGADTHVWFLWGTSGTLSGANQTSSLDLGSGTTNSGITANLGALNANTTYYFQMVAQNSAGTVKGTINSFLTPAKLPTATTGSASAVTKSSATMNGTVNPNGADTHVWFLWGTSSTLSGAYQTSSLDLGSGTLNYAITANLGSLTASKTYYFQMVAQNSAGTAKGSISSFTTPAH